MRKSLVAFALVLVASLGVVVPSAAAAVDPTDPKVVLIVGATHGATAGYRSDANVAYYEALKYTSNVIRVYSPDATWARVKAAVAGASIVVYLGHGNGWPSPYTYDPLYTTKDGFGLNATAGAGDYNNKYYGEPYVASLDLAPNAVVILSHLCYASGNSEPGNPEPSVTVARQRADNYAAGFLKAGASAVIADGHSGAEGYIRRFFTTHQSVEDMWRTMPQSAGHIVTFASKRTPGAQVFQDPNTTTSGFYRSLAINVDGVTTDDVVYGGVGDTGANPTTLTVPGNAAVTTDGAALYSGLDSTSAPAATLPAGTRLHVIEQPTQTTAVGGPTLVEVQGVDDPSITGFVATSDLAARDSVAPIVRSISTGGTFSPNGDGVVDDAVLRGRFTESVTWHVTVRKGDGPVLFSASGTGSSFSTSWNGLSNGTAVPDGTYDVAVTGNDAWDNGEASGARTVTVDTSPSKLTALTPASTTIQWFAPNGDGYRDTVALSATNSEAGSLTIRVRNQADTLIKKWTVGTGTGATSVTWDGRDAAGHVVPDGTYIIRVSPMDAVGNTGVAAERSVLVVAALKGVATSKATIYPQDGDGLAKTTTLSFTLLRPMTVTWTLRNAAGTVVDTHLDASDQVAGLHTWAFSGRTSEGVLLPAGRYTSSVSATDGTLVTSQSVAFTMDGFIISASDSTPARGQKISVWAVTTETLAAAPRLYIIQPGKAVWSVPMVKTVTHTYKAIITLKTGGSSGTMSFKVLGKDTLGGVNRALKAYPIH